MHSLKKLFHSKKHITIEEMANGLFLLHGTSEFLVNMKNRFIENIKKDESIEAIKLVNEEMLNFHFVALLIYAKDYATYLVFGNSTIKVKILDAYYDLVKKAYSKEYELLNIEVLALSGAMKDESQKDKLLNLGFYFSELITEKKVHKFSIAMLCSIEFGTIVVSIKDFLKELSSEFKIS